MINNIIEKLKTSDIDQLDKWMLWLTFAQVLVLIFSIPLTFICSTWLFMLFDVTFWKAAGCGALIATIRAI